MDTALTLRIAYENNERVADHVISRMLSESKLVDRLTSDYIEHPLFAVFRIMGLSEIPYIQELAYTKRLIAYVNRAIATTEGFSCLGGVEEIVPCYNAMLLEAYCCLGLANTKEAQAALTWIKRYQLFERGQTTPWPHKGVCKHGGCLGRTPCYVGIGKTIRALITYSECVGHSDNEVEGILIRGIDYMLRHKMYQRLTDGMPISAHIKDVMIPQSYALSLTDLVYIAGKRRLLHEPNCDPLLQLVQDKQVSGKLWKLDYLYTYKGYVGFESRREASEWISSLFPLWLYGLH